MIVSLAPMEGLTTVYYRQALARWFGGVDRWFTPFLTPTQDHRFTKRELREVLPEQNGALPTVPQLLTRSADDFLWAAGELAAMGYREVNLNLGCPSGTVVAKGKGSGFLAHPEELDIFLDKICSGAPCAISVKTRIGLTDPAEFPALLAIYRKYPLAELIVHPRVRTDMYKNTPRWDCFGAALEGSPFPVCYNGDLYTPGDAAALLAAFPGTERLMLGRGLAGDPALARRLKGGPAACRSELEGFVDQVYESYAQAFDSRRNAMLRMKEVWFYLIHLFQGGEKLSKRIKKARDPLDYEGAVRAVFQELELSPVLRPDW
nr:tRNA-dihydrouridine synthase family protein [uncultured Flavonifractor sp.]